MTELDQVVDLGPLTDDGLARKLEVRSIAGRDFLIIEAGGFDPAAIPTSWDRQYTIYMRVK